MDEDKTLDKDLVECKNCGKSFKKKDLDRSCSNCFACTSCETYICPECGNEIVVIPIKRKF
jgi:hypothetical protein